MSREYFQPENSEFAAKQEKTATERHKLYAVGKGVKKISRADLEEQKNKTAELVKEKPVLKSEQIIHEKNWLENSRANIDKQKRKEREKFERLTGKLTNVSKIESDTEH